MLMASVIQGRVVVVYNKERQEVCQHLEQDTPTNTTSSPQIFSLQATVAELQIKRVCWCNGSTFFSAAEPHCAQTVPGISHYTAIYLHLCVFVCVKEKEKGRDRQRERERGEFANTRLVWFELIIQELVANYEAIVELAQLA